jgi:hypothetical protein
VLVLIVRAMCISFVADQSAVVERGAVRSLSAGNDHGAGVWRLPAQTPAR